MTQKMRWVSIVGARPQFVKLAPVCRAVQAFNTSSDMQIEDVVVHTGQHYDAGMSDIFFDELHIPQPNERLEVGSASHGVQTARMLERIEALLLARKPDVVVVYGDTNSTLAGALAAAKLHIPIAHIEAGLRSFNRRMPEEVNRIATDHVSDLLLAPTPTAVENLRNENLAGRTQFTGDVMFDAVLYNSKLAISRSRIVEKLQLEPERFGVVTLHRAENTLPEVLRKLLDCLNDIAAQGMPLVFPLHPRTKQLIADPSFGWQPHANFKLIEPLGYLDMLRLVAASRMVLTDSGGLQKEAFFLTRPCITLRTETEWVETVSAGANIVTGADLSQIQAAVDRWLGADALSTVAAAVRQSTAFGDGDSASKIVRAIAGMKRTNLN
jgi:UDP-GlcNAc3NAcA epimerase